MSTKPEFLSNKGRPVKAQWRAAGAATAVVALLVVGWFGAGNQLRAEDLIREGTPTLSISPGGDPHGDFPHFSGLARELSKAVVNISVEADLDQADEEEELKKGFPFFKKDPQRPLYSMGSGIIITPTGYLLSNYHVIDRAKKIIVRLLDDKTDYEAKVIGRDQKTDMALLKVESKEPLHAVYFGDSDAIEVGEWVMAIGNQFQLGQTVTAGIVSAKARKVPSREGSPYDSYLQTDASINPGSSGGPLFNTRGQVIGMNTAIFSPGRSSAAQPGFNIGIGFAIPSNLIKQITPQLKEKGKVTRAYLGVIIQPVDGDVAKALGLDSPLGALIADVLPGSPAAKAKFERKDVIVGFNKQAVRDHDDLPLMVATTKIGMSLPVDVIRAGKRETLQVTVEELKEEAPAKEEDKPKANEVGLVIKPVSDEVAKALKVAPAGGVLVESVEPGSSAQRAGFARGDIIEELGGTPTGSPQSFAEALKKLAPGVPVLALVRKQEGTRFLTLKVPNRP